jgi:hypothetical protein
MAPKTYIIAARVRDGIAPTKKTYNKIKNAPAMAAAFIPSGFFKKKGNDRRDYGKVHTGQRKYV